MIRKFLARTLTGYLATGQYSHCSAPAYHGTVPLAYAMVSLLPFVYLKIGIHKSSFQVLAYSGYSHWPGVLATGLLGYGVLALASLLPLVYFSIGALSGNTGLPWLL